MKILITGADGQVGWELQRSLLGLGDIVALNRRQLDLSNVSALQNQIRQLKPQFIINAAAYTAVDRAEQEKDLALRINAHAPAIINEEAQRLDSFLIHYSTDYVFDGRKDSPYQESDDTCPINVYGESKQQGEKAILQSDSKHIVLRTSWVYAARGNNFLRTVVRLLGQQRDIGMINDQIGAPTWARYIAEVSAHIVRQWQSQQLTQTKSQRGLFHLCNSGQASWHEFAELIRGYLLDAQIYPELQDYLSRPIRAISSDQYPSVAARPRNSRLALTKLENVFSLYSPSWQSAAKLCLDDLLGSSAQPLKTPT